MLNVRFCYIAYFVFKSLHLFKLDFFYFSRLHDTNNDTKLDGLEIMAALSHIEHMFEIQPQEKQGKTEQEIEKLKEERKAGALQYFAGKFLLSPINISTILLQE